jgi:hypothetical protein
MNLGRLAIASLVLNLALGILIWKSRAAAERDSGPTVAKVVSAPEKQVMQMTTKAKPTSPAETPKQPEWPPFLWDGLFGGDYTHYVANLRRIGCPEEALGDIVRGATWTDLMRQVHGDSIQQHELLYGVFSASGNLEKVAQTLAEPATQARNARSELLRSLGIGEQRETTTRTSEEWTEHQIEREFSYVAPERRTALLAIETNSQARIKKAESDVRNGQGSQEEVDRLKSSFRLRQMQELNPDELVEFNRREWREKHGEQFQTLALVAQSPKEFRSLAGLSSDQLASALSPARMADLKRISEVRHEPAAAGGSSTGPAYFAVSGDFLNLQSVTRRFDLPDATPRAALDVIREYDDSLRKMGKDERLLPRERRQLVEALNAERALRLQGVLGREAWETYRFHFEDW